jgi:hypothetical protein
MNAPTLADLIRAAGFAQLAMVAAGLIACRKLEWTRQLAVLPPVMRQLFWTYGGYILGANLFFGIFCLAAPGAFLDRSPAASGLCLYLACFWGARLILQFTCFDRRAFGTGLFIRLAEAVLVALVVFLLAAYLLALGAHVT